MTKFLKIYKSSWNTNVFGNFNSCKIQKTLVLVIELCLGLKIETGIPI